eukprot:snap_masked-scaffold_129-processed-gene-0.8-mRNA-1 protein AED:1.00 eAED:1.00 QI:0/0/0/0/1/1/2/0/82
MFVPVEDILETSAESFTHWQSISTLRCLQLLTASTISTFSKTLSTLGCDFSLIASLACATFKVPVPLLFLILSHQHALWELT